METFLEYWELSQDAQRNVACYETSARTALAEVRIEVGGVELLQHTRRPFGGSLPDPRCCVWKSSLPLSG